MMPENWVEELHPRWCLETEAIDGQCEGAAVAFFPQVEADDGKWLSLIECEEPLIVVAP